MRIDVLTIFPEMFAVLDTSIIARARQSGIIELNVADIRGFSACKHRNTDDYPFGGGSGMLMTPQPIADAIKAVTPEPYTGKRIYMSPRGVLLTQKLAASLCKEPSIMILCGHYEGVDERIIQQYIDLEISIGDYVLTGGELPAMVLVDCVTRLMEGTLGGKNSHIEESFSDDCLLEYPQYTRPRIFEGLEVPDTLTNGNHAEIERWRRRQRILVTLQRRPELLNQANLTLEERSWLDQSQRAGN